VGKLSAKKIISRFLIPKFFVSIYYYLKYGAKISFSAEVELSRNIIMGKACTVSSFTKIKTSDGGILKMGTRSGFATCCFVSAQRGGVTIGDNFMCGPNVSIIASNYKYYEKSENMQDLDYDSKGIVIGNNVWIGANCVILDGSFIGDNTIVVANSLINRKYKSNVMLQGSPAKVIMTR